MDVQAILEFIDNTAIQIKDSVRTTKVNQKQSQRLADRINTVVFRLKSREETDLHRPDFQNYLEDFGTCINHCFQLVRSFRDDMCWYSNVFERQNHRQDFEKLNRELSQCANSLSLRLNVTHVFDPIQDKQDQEEDLNYIESNIVTIASMMEQQQSNQIRSCRIRTDEEKHRFNSYKYNLQQNILRARDSRKTQQMTNAEEFIHIPFYDLYMEQLIGRGGFANVYRGRWLSRDHEVAIKVIRNQHLTETVREDFIKEVDTLHRIRYEHVVNVYGACTEPEHYALVVEYMSLGSLYDILHQPTIDLIWHDRWSIALQTTKGINYLHALPKPILHRDIKSLNILMRESVPGFLVKITDFGLAKVLNENSFQSMPSSAAGSLLWQAPELLNLGKHTEATDVYALGIVLWELATRCVPYEGADPSIIIAFVRRGDRMKIPREVPHSFANIIYSAWHHDASQRPTSQQLLRLLKKACPSPDTSKSSSDTVRDWKTIKRNSLRESKLDSMLKAPDNTFAITQRPTTPTFNQRDLLPRDNSTPATIQVVDRNILLFGETGVGKTTFINALANYIHFKSLKQARQNEREVLISSSFLVTDESDVKRSTLNFDGLNLTDNDGCPNRSDTQQCRSYTILVDKCTRLNIIQTPGVNSSGTLDQNKMIMDNIQSFVKKHNRLNAICILLPPNEERFSVSFHLCLGQLFNILGQNARNHLIFCFTKTRVTSYTPGRTRSLLTKLRHQPSGELIPFNPSNTFCFDNESLRYLAAVKQGIKFQEKEEHEYQESWNKSAQETDRFLKYIRSLDTILVANE